MLTSEEAGSAWKSIFSDPLLSTTLLRSKGVKGRVTTLRSVHWKIYLSYLPSLDFASWPIVLARERGVYNDLHDKYVQSPNGSSAAAVDVSLNNPLSQDVSSPWQQFFQDTDLRKLIRQDVERTFPDVPYFRTPENQARMLSILFIYCKINQDVSYRQGMHELLAPILYVLDQDCVAASTRDSVVANCLSPTYVEHDAFVIFSAVMKYAKEWYQFNDEVFTRPNRNPNVHKSDTAVEAAKLTPVVAKCHRIHHHLLRTLDPELYKHLEGLGIEPQLYGIRWVRLLFGREFRLPELLVLWDGLFAEDPSLRIVDYVCVAMMMRIRNQLLTSDDSDCLHLLMRYNTVPATAQDIAGILSNAVYLRDNFSTEGGHAILSKLAQEAGVPMPVMQMPSPSPSLRSDRPQVQTIESFVSDVARGVIDTTGALGINKAILSTVADIKRNMNHLQSSAGIVPPMSPRLRASNSHTPSHTPTFAPTPPLSGHGTTSEAAEICRLRDVNRQMGAMVGASVEIIEREIFGENAASKTTTSSESAESNILPAQEVSILMALMGLKHVRDALKGVVEDFNPGLLDPVVYAAKSSEGTAGNAIADKVEKKDDSATSAAGPLTAPSQPNITQPEIIKSPTNAAATSASIAKPVTSPEPPPLPPPVNSPAPPIQVNSLSPALEGPGVSSHLFLSRRDDKPAVTLTRVPYRPSHKTTPSVTSPSITLSPTIPTHRTNKPASNSTSSSDPLGAL